MISHHTDECTALQSSDDITSHRWVHCITIFWWYHILPMSALYYNLLMISHHSDECTVLQSSDDITSWKKECTALQSSDDQWSNREMLLLLVENSTPYRHLCTLYLSWRSDLHDCLVSIAFCTISIVGPIFKLTAWNCYHLLWFKTCTDCPSDQALNVEYTS